MIAPVVVSLIDTSITTHAGWEWNFFINLPLGLTGVVLVASFVPHAADEGLRPFDLEGFLLTGSALSLTLAGLGDIAIPSLVLPAAVRDLHRILCDFVRHHKVPWEPNTKESRVARSSSGIAVGLHPDRDLNDQFAEWS